MIFVMVRKSNSNIKYKTADHAERLEARKFVYKRYVEVGYIKGPKEGMFEDEYLDQSTYLIAKEGNKVVGVIRVIENSRKGLPVINEFKIDLSSYLSKIDTKQIVEVGNLVAKPGHSIGIGLYKAAVSFSIEKGYKYWVAGIDLGLLKKLEKDYFFLSWMYKKIGEPMNYVGSMCAPILIKLKFLKVLYRFY